MSAVRAGRQRGRPGTEFGGELSGRIGRRGVALLILGVMEVMRGIVVWSVLEWEDDYAAAFNAIPPEVRTLGWATCGLLGIIGALHGRNARAQAVGYAALVIMPIERTVGHLWSFSAWAYPGGAVGDGYGWAWAVWWGCGTLLIWVLAGWDEDIPHQKVA